MTATDKNSRERQRIGLITGSGPEAGMDLWNKLLEATREQMAGRYGGDRDAPEVVIHSVPTLGLSMELPLNDEPVWQALKATATAMAQHVDVYAIACNTLNVYASRLQALQLQSRLVSMQGVLRQYLLDSHIQKVALLASAPVMALDEWSAYCDLSQWAQVELPKNKEALHELIYNVKVRGGEDAEVVQAFEQILDDLKAPVVLLACTELPLIPCTDRRLVDLTALLARELARIGQLPREA